MESSGVKTGSSGVQTRYSFYESESIDFTPMENEKSLDAVTETNSIESENSNEEGIELEHAQDLSLVMASRSGGDNSESSQVDEILKSLAETESLQQKKKTNEGKPADKTANLGKPPIYEGGISSISSASNSAMNAHEKAIRDALIYIRRRGQQRSAAVPVETETSGEGPLWTKGSDPLTVISSFPLSPGVDGAAAVATATKLDSRLLSPPADVRKAASDMFRHHDSDGDDNIDESDIAKPPFKGLELSHPVHSLPVPHFSVTPSSPAPGKSQYMYMNGQRDMINDAGTLEARRLSLELERRTRTEQEVEKGVEKVLLAILQRVDSKNNDSSGEAIENVLSSLFAEQTMSPDASAIGKVSPIRLNSEDNEADDAEVYGEDAAKISSVEALLAEDTEEEDTNCQGNADLDTSIQQADSEEGFGVEAIKSENSDDEYYDEIDDASHEEMVLGPLSSKMGGTTGVVLDADENGSASDNDEESADPKESSPSLISSVTSVAKRSSFLLQKLTFGSQRSLESSEALVKDLYSHILVRHPSYKTPKSATTKEGFSKWMSEKFTTPVDEQATLSWDESDPEEPGYVTHTFSRAKLQEIEHMFEDIMERAGSEYAVVMKESVNNPKKPCSDFERDLLEAEQLLDKTQAKTKEVKNKQVKKEESEQTPLTSPETLQTNSNFPGAKAAGSGDVGELEIYHLPIIYKAHQTGFEPTKDLVLQPDSVFAGQYYVQSELGSAAFSTAYRCVDLNSGKKAEDGEIYYDEVCLKVIKNTKDFFDQSLDEIKILELLRQTGQCSENNILEMKAFFYHKEHLIIVTELLRQNLFEFGKYITEHDEPLYFTRSRLCYIARQCLVALSFVHKLGLVHSDIKPENILLASYSRARVKVIDFGSSCYLTDRQSSYIQSRSYRAPEVVLGLPYDGKIDVWSLGCVIAEMFTGQVTFQNDSVVSMLSRIEAICGAFPRNMVDEGRQSGQFFTPTGLLYEKVENDDDSAIRMDTSTSFNDEDSTAGENTLYHIFQPKTTTMAERLGFDANLLRSKRKTWEEDEKALFTDFVSKLLTIDPEKRPSAEEALEHPWILSGFNLTEEDLKYPPEE